MVTAPTTPLPLSCGTEPPKTESEEGTGAVERLLRGQGQDGPAAPRGGTSQKEGLLGNPPNPVQRGARGAVSADVGCLALQVRVVGAVGSSRAWFTALKAEYGWEEPFFHADAF